MVRNDPNAQTAVDMREARRKSSLDIPVLRDYLHGGNSEWEIHRRIVETLSLDPVFDKSRRPFMNRSELYTQALAVTRRIEELREIHHWSTKEAAVAMGACDGVVTLGLHKVAFTPIVMSQGSPQLIAKYGPLMANQGILGCYLQTELGHGTNVAGLETTATYIPETQEFDIHSPTLTSTKWWVGSLGKTSTHGVLQAQLVLPGGERVGPHLFFIQLRSLDDHKVLPGIQIGDIGPKALSGMPANDNGFARFNHVRISREQMLSKFAQVTADGQYIQPPHAKISYSGMLYIRSSMVTTAGWVLAKAATVSIRYATVRRQGSQEPNGLERQVITYSSEYYRIIPILSRAYVYIHLGRNLSRAFDAMLIRLASGDISLLAEMHAMTSGLKVLVSTTSVADVETARRSMGGHGYSAFAGLGRIYADHLPSATYEGDNFVLDQQVVRAALKSFRAVMTSGVASGTTPSSAYLRHLLPGARPPAPGDDAWVDPQTSVLLLEWRAARVVAARAAHDGDLDASVDQRASRAVSEAFVAGEVGRMIADAPLRGSERRVTAELFRLYLLVTVESALVDILSYELLPSSPLASDPTRALRVAIDRLCRELLPEVIGLTDAFGFTDWELDSSLGVYDGRVYEALWNRAQAEPLNQTEVPDGYEEYIKPVLERGQTLAAHETKPKL